MTITSFYDLQLNKKVSWRVVKGTAGPVLSGAENAIARALELRILELEVEAFLRDGSIREVSRLTDDMRRIILSNMEDERKHDEALNHAASVYQLASPDDTRDAQAIAQEWINHPDHPILKTAVLERSVFFVLLPMFRFLTSGCLKVTSQDISNDENVHAAAHTQMAIDLGLTVSPSLNKLRKDTVEWVVEHLDAEGKWGNPDLWRRSSDMLFNKGIAPELAQTSSYSMPAFFEKDNRNLPSYG